MQTITSWIKQHQQLATVIVVAIALAFVLLIVRAAGPFVSFEAESATFSGGVIAKTDASTSSGSYAEFTAPPPPPPPPSADYPAQPAAGNLFWGSNLAGQADPTERFEIPSGEILGLRRTFFQWNHRTTGYLFNTVKADKAKGRLSWVSLKTFAKLPV